MTYERPDRLDAALAALARAPHLVLAGGTDVYPAAVGRTLERPILDLSALDAMRGVTVVDGALRIGALTTWSEIARLPLPRHCAALAQAAREIGGLQIQNRGTIGGNLCNASPAADGIPPLLALDASVELASATGVRTLPVAQFVLGNRRTACRPDELLVAVRVPARSPAAASTFLKLGHRRYLVISIAMVAVVLDFDAAGRVAYCGVAVGACSAAAQRLPVLESGVLGAARGEVSARATALLSQPAALAPLSPIDDVRGTRAYRLDAVRRLLARALTELTS
ncbi:MAG: FAD binding domain-containing protein [Pseudomonadota bacterium]